MADKRSDNRTPRKDGGSEAPRPRWRSSSWCSGSLSPACSRWVTSTVNNRNENRLLQEQVNEAGTVVSGVLPTLEIPLASGQALPGHHRPDRPIHPVHRPVRRAWRPLRLPALCGVDELGLRQCSAPWNAQRRGDGRGVRPSVISLQSLTHLRRSRSEGCSMRDRVGLSYASPGSVLPMGVYRNISCRRIVTSTFPSRPVLESEFRPVPRPGSAGREPLGGHHRPIADQRHARNEHRPLRQHRTDPGGHPDPTTRRQPPRRVTPVVILVGVCWPSERR